MLRVGVVLIERDAHWKRWVSLCVSVSVVCARARAREHNGEEAAAPSPLRPSLARNAGGEKPPALPPSLSLPLSLPNLRRRRARAQRPIAQRRRSARIGSRITTAPLEKPTHTHRASKEQQRHTRTCSPHSPARTQQHTKPQPNKQKCPPSTAPSHQRAARSCSIQLTAH